MQRTLDVEYRHEAPGELDLRALGSVLKRRRRTIIIPTALAFLLVCAFVTLVTPRYTAESQVLLENQETFFTRPDRVSTPSEQASLVDPEAVGSQIQLITSRDLARRAIRDLKLLGNPEFDPAARGMGALTRVLVLLGVARDPTRDTVDARVLQAFADRLTVYSPPKTRVITIQFQSKDPELAARVANKLADLYIDEQSAAKRLGAKDAADALGGQIADLRIKLAKADAEREQYRAESGLLAGTNNMTISGQQLADINSDLSRARSTQADAQAKASLLRDLIRSGKTADVTEVVNNDLVRRVGEQRVTAQAQLAQESRTLLPGHPRIKELTAQVADLNAALKAAAKQAVSTLENEAKISGQRVANLEAVLAQQKKVAGTANGDEVRLRSLDRVAQSYKDQLDSSTTKYQEALSRQTSTATPADARVIARAVAPQEASYPKKLPYVVFGTLAAFAFASGFVIARELLTTPDDAGRDRVPAAPAPAVRSANIVEPAAVEPVSAVIEEHRPSSLRTAPVAAPLANPQVLPAPTLVEPPRRGVPPERPPFAKLPSRSGWDLPGVLDKLRSFGQSAAASRAASAPPVTASDPPLPQGVGWDGGSAPRAPERWTSAPSPSIPGNQAIPEDQAGNRGDIEALAARIVSAHVPGRGLHVVGASLGSSSGTADDLLALGRALADRGRAVVVDLNATPQNLAPLVDVEQKGGQGIAALPGLSELLSGGASFAEVIHRDYASRLHFIPTGRRDADFRDFDLILDALSETYDFVILLAPAFPHSDIAKVMAPYADLVVLSAASASDTATLRFVKAELIEAGAQEVLVTGGELAVDAALTPHVA